jgi:CheY-specific phosphatase CheX
MATTVAFQDVVFASAKEVFESMVFMRVEETSDRLLNPEAVTLLATITFTGRLEGCFSLCCDRLCAAAVAANMLCLDSAEDLGADDIVDAVGEIANMVMGAVKTRIQDQFPNIDISIPSVVEGRQLASRVGEGTVKTTVTVTVDNEHRAEFSLLYRCNES